MYILRVYLVTRDKSQLAVHLSNDNAMRRLLRDGVGINEVQKKYLSLCYVSDVVCSVIRVPGGVLDRRDWKNGRVFCSAAIGRRGVNGAPLFHRLVVHNIRTMTVGCRYLHMYVKILSYVTSICDDLRYIPPKLRSRSTWSAGVTLLLGLANQPAGRLIAWSAIKLPSWRGPTGMIGYDSTTRTVSTCSCAAVSGVIRGCIQRSRHVVFSTAVLILVLLLYRHLHEPVHTCSTSGYRCTPHPHFSCASFSSLE